MLKTGIYKLNQIKAAATIDSTSFTNLFADEKEISITLYEQVQQLPNGNELAERVLLLFKDDRGAYKRTYINRFPEFDAIVLGQINSHFKPEDHLIIHDVGVSDGRTALDLFEKVIPIFTNCKYIASDYNAKVYILTKDKCTVTISHNGQILEILWPPFVFTKIRLNRFLFLYPLNHVIRFFIQLLYVYPIIKDYKSGKLTATELTLFAPKVLERSKNDPRLSLERQDLLQPFKEPANVIRAMNVLNPSYFTKDELHKIINNIYIGLKDGGLFILGSNQNAGTLVHGGIYKKTSSGFKLVNKSGDGLVIEPLILVAR